MEEFSRTELLIKKEGLEKLQNSSVAVFGVGGVGGFVIEALVRAGIGTIHIVDHDSVSYLLTLIAMLKSMTISFYQKQ